MASELWGQFSPSLLSTSAQWMYLSSFKYSLRNNFLHASRSLQKPQRTTTSTTTTITTVKPV